MIGFGLEIGVLGYAHLGPCIHFLVLVLLNLFGLPVEFYSWPSLGIALIEILLVLFGLGFRITVTPQHFRVAEVFLGIPFSGFKAKLEAVSLTDPLISGKVADVHVYIAEDLWEDFGQKNWVEILHKGKEYGVAGNHNHEAYFQAITQAVAEQRKG